MRFQHSLTLRDYVAAGDETTAELLGAPNEFVAALEQADRFFVRDLFDGDIALDPVPGLLAWNAFTLVLGGVRLALSGHEAATFPVLRTALESACYAYRMVEAPALVEVWLKRNDSEAAQKASRAAFTPAVKHTAARLRQDRHDIGDLIELIYEAAIDFGGHPNPRSVLGYLTFKTVEDSNFEHLNMGVLYGGDDWKTRRAIIVCLDFAVAIGFVLLHTPKVGTQKAADALSALIQEKDRLAAAMNA